jgi:hypothetical protein
MARLTIPKRLSAIVVSLGICACAGDDGGGRDATVTDRGMDAAAMDAMAMDAGDSGAPFDSGEDPSLFCIPDGTADGSQPMCPVHPDPTGECGPGCRAVG